MDAAVVGRERELAEVTGFVDGADGPASLLLAGEPGVGKTTLWRVGVERAVERDRVVLATRPLEAEAKLAYAGLGDLLTEAHAAVGELPSPQAHALRAALLLEEPVGGEVDERAVALGLHGVLVALAVERSVLVAVDDIQWLDRPSARALSFAARRLAAEPIRFLLALREEARSTLDAPPERVFPAYTELAVRPLGFDEVHLLLQQRLALVLPLPALRALHAMAGGNPFYALELARAYAAGGEAHAPGELPAVPATLRELVGGRVAALPKETKAVLLAAAALADPALELVGQATGLDAAAALAGAVDGEIVAVSRGRILFAHPLLAAAAYGAADPAARRDIHARLADLVADPEQHARHLALAAPGPDAAVAAALDEAARLARARGAPSAAAELLEEARALTPPADAAAARRRGIEAAKHHFAAGDAVRARALLEEAVAALPPGRERAGALLVLGRIRSYDDDIRAALELFETALAEAADDPSVAGHAHEGIAAILFRLRERFGEAVEHAQVALRIAEELGDVELVSASLGSQLLAEATNGREDARLTFRAAAAVVDAGGRTRVMQGSGIAICVVQMWWEDFDGAAASYELMLERAEAAGDESSVPYFHVLFGQLECLRGHFDEAATHAETAARRAEQGGQRTVHAYALAGAALADAHRGREAAARAAAEAALTLADRTSGRPAEHVARTALGLLEVSLGRHAEAVDTLLPLATYAREQELREPGLTRFATDLVEALVALGRLDEADDQLRWYEADAVRLGRTGALAAVARCRGYLAGAVDDLTAAVQAFELARAHGDRAPLPFDRPRTLLALGAALRRAKQRREAREVLEEARGAFGSLGALIWEERAVAELARIGGRAPSRGELTPVERRVAELVAAGKSNREVSTELFLSVRTVEGHLSHVYGKLGVRSRVELARKLA